MVNIVKNSTPRVKIIQKLYSKTLNPDEKIIYNKSQYKKFIKDVTEGTIERKELIEETDDINLKPLSIEIEQIDSTTTDISNKIEEKITKRTRQLRLFITNGNCFIWYR